MEKCPNGDLKEELILRKRRNSPFSEEEALKIFRDILKGYLTCFELKVIHRDLKPANILINGGVYKLADFGMGRVIEE